MLGFKRKASLNQPSVAQRNMEARVRQKCSKKGQIVNTFAFKGHPVSVATTHFCCYSRKAVTDSTEISV